MATIYGNWLANTLDSNDGVTNGADTIFGYGGTDTIYGLGGDDIIWGGEDSWTPLFGGGGSGPRNEVLDGGPGTDTAMYLDSLYGVEVYLDGGFGVGGVAAGDLLYNIENVTGSVYGDVLVGDGGGNVLTGQSGDDELNGQGGNDTLIGGLGGDELIGGGGTDTASYAGALFGVAANLATGGSIGEAAGDTFETIENLTGSFFADTLTGDANANVLDGGSGADQLMGGGAGDTLIGGSGTDTALYTDSDVGVTINQISGLGFDGTAEGDTLSGIENVTGSLHDDDLTGDANVNLLFGSNGDDTLKGGGGADTLDGGSGIDTIRYDDSGSGVTVELLGGTGSGGTAAGDTLIGIENVVGSTYADTLTGDEDDNELFGGSGDDWLTGGGGADTLDGGLGNDTATYLNDGSGVTVSLLTGTGSGSAAQGDTLIGIENLYGTVYADTLTGDAGANILHGDSGDDTLTGGGGADRLIGGSGSDTAIYTNSTAAVTINLTAGTGVGGAAEGDTLTQIENVTGSQHADTLTGDQNDNTLRGLGGDDTLWGGAGADTLDGGGGNDTATYIESGTDVHVNLLTGTGWGGTAEGDALTGIENLTGSIFDDDLTGDDRDNLLVGGIGVDELVGNGGNDTLEGGIGDDWLVGGAGADTLAGGTGSDFISYYNSAAGVTIDLAAGTASGGDAAGDTFTSIENIAGSDFADVLTGNAGSNFLLGDDGDDTLIGGLGADLLAGFSGIDTVSYAASTAAVTVDLAAGTGSGGDAAGDTFSSVENVIGSDLADTLVGNGSANVLVGRNGDDAYVVDSATDTVTENGGQGIDTVRTSASFVLTAGADVEVLETSDDNGTTNIDLTGNTTNNIIRGNSGDNVVAGGDGNDELTGLAGQDSFLFDTALDAAANLDEITDFDVADDTILLDDAIFSSSLGLGSISSGEFVIGAAALDANDRIIYNDVTGGLFYDSDGVGGTVAIQFAELTPGLALTFQDFVVV